MRRQRVADDVDRGVVDDRQIVGGGATADFVRQRLRFLEVAGGDRRHFDALHLGVGPRMRAAHEPRAEDSDPHENPPIELSGQTE